MCLSSIEKWRYRCWSYQVSFFIIRSLSHCHILIYRHNSHQFLFLVPYLHLYLLNLSCLHACDSSLNHRNPSNLVIPKGSGGNDAGKPLTDPNLILLGGDVTKQSDVDQVFAAVPKIDGVIVALGGKTADVGETMLTDGTKNIIQAMKQNNVRRIAVVTSIGAGDSESQAPFFFKVLMWTAMKKIFTDKNNQEAVVAASGLDYCIVRPGGLTVEPPTGIINVIQGEAGSIARADVAAFCLGAVTQEDFEYIGQAPCISSVGGTGWVKDRSAKARMGDAVEK